MNSKSYRVTGSVARWLSPESAKWCYEKLLDSAKYLVTNFQLKSGKSSEILPKNLLIFRILKLIVKLRSINFWS